jgi:prepilin peptidase CpaA
LLYSFLTSCAILLLIWAALHDLAARTVPNALPAAILGIGICVRTMGHSVFFSLLIASAIFIILFAFWLMGAIGGGDVKLWGASAVLIPPHLQTEFSCITRILLTGGGLALLYLTLRLIVRRPRASLSGSLVTRVARAEAWRISRKAPLPYAFAIAGGTIFTLLPLSFSALR